MPGSGFKDLYDPLRNTPADHAAALRDAKRRLRAKDRKWEAPYFWAPYVLVGFGQAVLILKGTIDYFINTVFNYPTRAVCYKAAAFNGLNKLNRFG